MKLIKVFMLLTLFAVNVVIAQSACKATYIANTGFMIEIGKNKILVDAVFANIEGDWCEKPSEEILNKIKEGKPPFDNINLIAVTHYHVDHFNASILTDVMVNNPNTKAVVTKQIDEKLKENKSYDIIKNNILILFPTPEKDEYVNVGNIEVRGINLKHNTYFEKDTKSGETVNRHEKVENNGYIFNVGGIKAMHTGDWSSENILVNKTLNLKEEKILTLFLQKSFFKQAGIEFILECGNSKNVIMMHLSDTDVPKFQKYAADIKHIVDNIYIFNKPMDVKIFNSQNGADKK